MKLVYSRNEYLQYIAPLLPANNIGVELGVLHGDFSEMLLVAFKPERLYLVDPYGLTSDKQQKNYGGDGGFGQLDTAYSKIEDYENLKKRFAKQISEGRVIIKRNYSFDVVDFFEDGALDFIYEDSCHTYEIVKRNLELYAPKLKKLGIILGHDYNIPDVAKAVDEFAEDYNWKIIALNENGFDFALGKII